MVENRAGGAEGAGETTGAEGAQAGEGAAGGTRATGAAKRGGRRGAGAARGEGAAGEGGTTKTTRGRRGAGAAGGGEEGGATGTRKRGGRAAGGTSAGRAGGAAGGRGGRGRKAAAQQGPDMRQDLRDFANAHQQGWSHHDWLNLVNALEQRGHDVSDRDRIGRELERERLAMRLEQVQGMGERRVQALADHFGTLWSLRQASVDEIAGVPNINRQLAEKIQEQLR